MIYELRTYTINQGMMESWIQNFNEKLVRLMGKFNIKVEGAWVNQDRNQFIWIRSFADTDDVKAKEAEILASQEWIAISDHTRSHLARTSWETMESVLKVPTDR